MKTYLAAFTIVPAAIFLLIWGVIGLEFSKIEPLDYQFTLAHDAYLSSCKIGDVAILGDSTADADFIPSRIGPDVYAYSMAGATPIENYFLARKILNCPVKPKAVILSFTAASFRPFPTFPTAPGTYYWTRALPQGVISFPDAMQVLENSERLGDLSLVGTPSVFDLDYRIRAFLTVIRFPPYFYPEFSVFALSEAKSLLRRPKPSLVAEAYAQTQLDGGHHFFGTQAEGTEGGDFDAMRSQESASSLSRFQVSRLSDFYMHRLIEIFQDAGVKVYIVEPPRNESAYLAYSPDLVDRYQQYLLTVSRAEPGTALLDPGFHVWDPTLFGDLAHLNVRGADAYSDEIRQALVAGGQTNLVSSDADVAARNLYDNSGLPDGSGFQIANPGLTAVSAGDVSIPELRYPSAQPVWSAISPANGTPNGVEKLAAPALHLDAGTHYAVAVFVKSDTARDVSLHLSWPGRPSGAVGWSFSRREISYSGMANKFNSGVTICPGGWVQLYLSAATGPKADIYPGPTVMFPARSGSVDVYDVSVEQGLWPVNYCTLQPGESKMIPPVMETASTTN
jgi:hypothetical protein